MCTIAVISAGAMGAAVGRRLRDAGCTVLTSLDGRSEATRQRAIEAGMQDASLAEIAEKASWLLSIMPPSEAQSFAAKYVTVAKKNTSNHLVFVDCNAVSPKTVKQIASLFDPSMSFIDATIIGGPPGNGYDPTFYASGNDKELIKEFSALSAYGLKITPLTDEGAGIGDASALKMSYAGITKGITGLFTTMILAAHSASPATATALRTELSLSQPELLRRIDRVVPPMLPKAYRWVGEMEEISDFVGDNEGLIHKGIAQLYARIEQAQKEGNDDSDVRVLEKFVQGY